MLNTIIIDDEATGRSTLRNFLTRYCDGVAIVGEADSSEAAFQLIAACRPQLLFLDIDMPGGSGFDLLSRFELPDFHTVFVTAHDQHGLQAIKHRAVDYLLKPVDIDELIRAVDRARQLIRQHSIAKHAFETPAAAPALQAGSDKIALPVLEGFMYKNASDIVRCEADGNYTQFFFTDGTKLLVCRTLGTYEAQLAPKGFVRIHHHHLVNINHITKYQRGRGGAVILSDKSELVVAQRKKDELLRILNQGYGEAI